MKQQNQHSDRHHEFFSKVSIPYSSKKEDIWEQISENIPEESKPLKTKTLRVVMYAVAATVALMIGFGTFARFYSVSVDVPGGQHFTKRLPGGSQVTINAGSILKYNPYWWAISRNVSLEGEAYFEVTKGSRFKVKSNRGTIEVLGTRFNVYARNKKLAVNCLSGAVKVQSKTGTQKILRKNQAIRQVNNKQPEMHENVNPENAIAWTNNKFIFTTTPLREVFAELERQFNIRINLEQNIHGNYTGNFQRGSSPRKILEIISKPFGLNVVKIDNGHFKIEQKSH